MLHPHAVPVTPRLYTGGDMNADFRHQGSIIGTQAGPYLPATVTGIPDR